MNSLHIGLLIDTKLPGGLTELLIIRLLWQNLSTDNGSDFFSVQHNVDGKIHQSCMAIVCSGAFIVAFNTAAVSLGGITSIFHAEIREVMAKAIPEPRKEVSKWAPKMVTFNIDPDKIRDVIGTGGKVINDIIAKCGQVKIDVEETGKITIYHTDKAMIEKARQRIDDIVREAKVGEIYEGKITRVENYGAFVNLFGDTDGLCHVSRLDWKYVDDANNFVKVGDTLKVVVIGLEEGKIKLSHREFIEKPADFVERPERPERPAGPRNGGTHDHGGKPRNGGNRGGNRR